VHVAKPPRSAQATDTAELNDPIEVIVQNVTTDCPGVAWRMLGEQAIEKSSTGPGVGDGVGVGRGDGVAVGVGERVGVAFGDAVAVGGRVGVTVAELGVGVGPAVALGWSVGSGVAGAAEGDSSTGADVAGCSLGPWLALSADAIAAGGGTGEPSAAFRVGVNSSASPPDSAAHHVAGHTGVPMLTIRTAPSDMTTNASLVPDASTGGAASDRTSTLKLA
jgi:hypothetical protein